LLCNIPHLRAQRYGITYALEHGGGERRRRKKGKKLETLRFEEKKVKRKKGEKERGVRKSALAIVPRVGGGDEERG
jgi:hypothetical protein